MLWSKLFVLIPKELMKRSSIAQEKLALTRRESQEVVILTSRLITRVGLILTCKADYLFGPLVLVLGETM
jgi:hypothetical protein